MNENKTYKEYKNKLDISPIMQKGDSTNAVVYSFDLDTSKFTYELKMNGQQLSLANASEVNIVLYFGGDNPDKYPKANLVGTIEDKLNGKISFVMPKQYLGFDGQVLGEINVTYNNGQSLTAGYFSFVMKPSYVNGGIEIEQKVYVEQFEDLKNLIGKQSEDINEILLVMQEDIKESNAKVDEIKDLIVKNDVFKKTDGEKVQKIIEDSQYSKVLNKNFSSLKSRLDFSDSILFSQVPSGFKFIIEHTSEYQPDITVTSYRNALETELDGFDTGPVFGGETIFNVPTQLSYDRKKIFVEMPLFYALKGEVTIPKEDTLLLISGTDVLCFTVTGAQIKSGNYPGEEPVSAVRVPRELEVTSIDDKTIKLTWNRGE